MKALDVVASTIENSDVNGCVGGYSVLADGRDDKNQKLGKAGGFIGEMSGTIIKNSDANLFNYIIGREAAGGYAGIITGKCCFRNRRCRYFRWTVKCNR